MLHVVFELTMPGVGSWNGRWSGESKYYAVTRSASKKYEAELRKALEKPSYYYSWSDGWAASVHVREVDAKEAAKCRKKSQGFCNYGWMVDSILKYGRIVTASDLEKEKAQVAANPIDNMGNPV